MKLVRRPGTVKGKTKAGHAFWGILGDDLEATARRFFGKAPERGLGGATWEDVSERSATLCVEKHESWRSALGGGNSAEERAAMAEFQRLLDTHGVTCRKLDGSRFILRRDR